MGAKRIIKPNIKNSLKARRIKETKVVVTQKTEN